MSDLITQGGAGGAGALFGAFLSWFGFKQRLDAQDKRLDMLSKDVMYENTCEAKTIGLEKRMQDQNVLLAEMREDVKRLLRRLS